MSDARELDITASSSRRGDADARSQLLQVLYDELREMAGRQMRREAPNHTLQPTALVSEAYLRLCNQHELDWANRSHVLALAATMMRRVLLDHARQKGRRPRATAAPESTAVELVPNALVIDAEDLSGFIDLDAALTKLADVHERQARVVELRYIGGLSEDEAAQALGVSSDTVKRDWRFARAWLNRELGGALSE